MKLIDADALNKKISISHSMTEDCGIKTGYEISMRLIDEQPEAVIRCKDCKYLYRSSSPVWQFWCDREMITFKVRADGFCSFAERKTDE